MLRNNFFDKYAQIITFLGLKIFRKKTLETIEKSRKNVYYIT